LCPFHSAIPTAPQSAHRFHPAKDFFHPFAKALAGPVTGAPGCTSIQSRNLSPLFARRVRRHRPFPAAGHELLLVIRFVPTEGLNPGFVQFPIVNEALGLVRAKTKTTTNNSARVSAATKSNSIPRMARQSHG
jgi:hypothetical protein